MLIAEHKSRGRNLDTAYKQVLGYFSGLPERDLPRFVIVSDFARFRLYDLDADTRNEFPLKDLYRRIKLFGFISGFTACYESGEIMIDTAELSDAAWYSPDELPSIPGKGTIARQLIDWFLSSCTDRYGSYSGNFDRLSVSD